MNIFTPHTGSGGTVGGLSMKNHQLGLGLGALVLSWAFLCLFQGCNSVVPPVTSVVPAPLPVSVVSNFHEGSLQVNPTLTNGTGGYFTAETSGGSIGHTNMINNSASPILLYPRADTGQYAVHIYGTQTDTAPTGYPSMELYGFLRNDPSDPSDPYIYDLSSFTGVQYDIMIGADDTNVARWFEVGVSQNTPPTANPGGSCQPPFSSNCYNYFNQNIPVGPGSGWQTVQVLFSSMNIRFSAGDGLAGPLTGSVVINGKTVTFESQALFLLWQVSNNGNTHSTYTDMWIDNVELF